MQPPEQGRPQLLVFPWKAKSDEFYVAMGVQFMKSLFCLNLFFFQLWGCSIAVRVYSQLRTTRLRKLLKERHRKKTGVSRFSFVEESLPRSESTLLCDLRYIWSDSNHSSTLQQSQNSSETNDSFGCTVIAKFVKITIKCPCNSLLSL